MPTTDTGISGSSTWRRASHRRASTLALGENSRMGLVLSTAPPERTGLVPPLEGRHVVAVHRPAGAPAHQHLIPRHRPLVEQPLPLLLVKARRERAVDHVPP